SRYESLHRAHVDNESRAPCAHVRQHGLARPNDTEYIGVEKRLRLLDRGLLECAEYAETRIVDEHIDAPCGIDHGLHRPPDGVSDGDVERQETDARTGGRLLRRSRRAKDPIPAADEVLRRCGADSARGAGDEDDFLL